MKGKSVLVTGGTGFVGSHLVENLVKRGAKVFVTTRSEDSSQYFFSSGFDKKAVMVYCDLKDKERVANVISDHEIDYVFHMGAQALVTVAHTYPYETLMSNIVGTINVLEAARHCSHVKGILVFTSDKAYGKQDEIPYKETNPLKGMHPYDCSKSCADLIAQMYYKTYNLPVVIVRSGNIFGPGDLNYNRIIPGAIKAVIENEALQIRSDGTMVREYVYVKDVADACTELIANLDKTKGEAFNIGSSSIFSVIELLDSVGNIINRPIARNILNIAKNEIPKQHLDYDKIRRTIGWNNKNSFAEAITETYDWYTRFGGLNGN